MAYTVLIVDDSSFFQHRLKTIINEHPQLDVIGTASNGQEAIAADEALKPDIISMDYEMPLLDGISALKAILAKRKVPIVMFSSLTYDGARITLEALDAGAVDFISKSFAEVSQNSAKLKRTLHNTLITFAQQACEKKHLEQHSAEAASESNSPPISIVGSHAVAKETVAKDIATEPVVKTGNAKTSNFKTAVAGVPSRPKTAKILIIGASTGGPVIVHQLLAGLPADYPLPVVIIQHMPASFTRALAERLDRICTIRVKQAEHGEQLKAGVAFIAEGEKQLIFDCNIKGSLKLIAGDDRVSYAPSVDLAFASAANVFKREVLGLVLTGMGTDGLEGAKIIKEKGGSLWTQNRESCIVYGMPKAVENAGLSNHVLTPEIMGLALNKEE